jgi:HTH-like domain
LAAAHKRIAVLEAELALTRDACELFNEQAVVPPKHRRAIAEGLIARGYSGWSACRITGLARSLLQYQRRRLVPDREIRRLIVADTITEIHQRSRGTYGRRRVRAALLADYDMNVNLKLVKSIMTEQGLYGMPRPGRRLPNLITTIGHLPEALRETLTWDQGAEMAEHRAFSMATDMDVYFADPGAPWQRGSNENTNGVLRQYFPRGADLSQHSAQELRAVADELNGRPRKTLDWDTPAERLAALLDAT